MSTELGLEDATFQKLTQIGGYEFAVQMIDLFLSYVPQKLIEARVAAQAGDWVGVQKAVHPIKSSASNIGARSLRELAVRLEQLAIDQQGDSIPALLGEMEVALAEVKSLLELQREKLHVQGKESAQ